MYYKYFIEIEGEKIMTSVEFVKTAAANSDLTQKEVKAACDVIENTIIAMAKDGKKFTVAGFIFEGKTADQIWSAAFGA